MEDVAKESAVLQSTSSVGAEWKANCCFILPVLTSHTMAVLSTEPLSKLSPVLFHLREKIGPLCCFNVITSLPFVSQMRA